MTEDSSPEIQKYSDEFKPFALDTNKVLHDIELLDNGEALHLGHSFTVLSFGDQRVSIDPIIEGVEFKVNGKSIFPGRVFPPLGDDSLRMDDKKSKYNTSLVQTSPLELTDLEQKITNTRLVGEALGFGLNKVFISHLDPDHLDMELISGMMEANPDLVVYGPQGLIKWVEKSNPESKRFEKLKDRLQELQPTRVFATEQPGETTLSEQEANKIEFGNGTSVTSFEVVHGGSKTADITQAFLIENKDTRTLACPEAAFSPEIINILKKVHTSEKPLTSIVLSTGIYNPDRYHEVLPVAVTKMIKDEIEEFSSHSVFLPFIFQAMTDGQVPIYLTHHGYYYKDRAVKGNVPYRIPVTEGGTIDPNDWLLKFKEFILKTEDNFKSRLEPLRPSSFPRAPFPERIKHWETRRSFSKNIRGWMAENPLPKQLLDSIHLPQGGETINLK